MMKLYRSLRWHVCRRTSDAHGKAWCKKLCEALNLFKFQSIGFRSFAKIKQLAHSPIGIKTVATLSTVRQLYMLDQVFGILVPNCPHRDKSMMFWQHQLLENYVLNCAQFVSMIRPPYFSAKVSFGPFYGRIKAKVSCMRVCNDFRLHLSSSFRALISKWKRFEAIRNNRFQLSPPSKVQINSIGVAWGRTLARQASAAWTYAPSHPNFFGSDWQCWI